MGARLDEHGLTPKKKMFADEYLKTGNMHQSYLSTHVVKEGTKRGTTEQQAKRLVREPSVEAYIKKKQAELAAKSDVDTRFVINALMQVVNNNVGKHTSVRALELLGKIHGYFWEKPAKKLDGEVSMDNNTKATQQILNMMREGLITEESAAAWIQSIDQKSKLEERENTNKEILDKLNTINSAMEKKDEQA